MQPKTKHKDEKELFIFQIQCPLLLSEFPIFYGLDSLTSVLRGEITFKEVFTKPENFLAQDKENSACANDIEDAGEVRKQPCEISVKSAEELRQGIECNPNIEDNLVVFLVSKQIIKRYRILIEG